jgi:hypothetical protein
MWDELEVDTDADTVGVINAINGLEKSDTKLPLRKIIADTWNTWSTKSMGELKSINYQTVVNTQMEDAISDAYAISDLDVVDETPLTLHSDDISGAFAAMAGSPFGIGTSKFLQETDWFQGRSITSIDLTGTSKVQFNF